MATEEIEQLRERAKELGCLYRVNEVLLDRARAPHVVFREVLDALPPGWQRPDTTRGRITYLGRHYFASDFDVEGAELHAPIRTWNIEVGAVEVSDRAVPAGSENAFLPEERALLDAIAARLGDYLEWKQQELVGEPIGAAAAQWRWRQELAERLAAALDPERFGVTAVYLHGSTERGEAAPTSDIDLAIVFRGTEEQRRDLTLWLEGWSLCLGEMAYRQAGSLVAGGLLDVSWLSHEPTASEQFRMRALPLRERR